MIDAGVRVTLLLNTSRDDRWLSRLLTSDLSILRLRVTSGAFRTVGSPAEVVKNISILHPGAEFGGGSGSGVGVGVGSGIGNGQTALGKSEQLPLLQVCVCSCNLDEIFNTA